MATPIQIWDAYRTLNITNPTTKGLVCVGTTLHKKRCRWDIPEAREDRVRSILNEMETKAPRKAIPLLQHLAKLTLCVESHRDQVGSVVEKWTAAIEVAERIYARRRMLIEKNKDLKERLEEERGKTRILERALERLENSHRMGVHIFDRSGSMEKENPMMMWSKPVSWTSSAGTQNEDGSRHDSEQRTLNDDVEAARNNLEKEYGDFGWTTPCELEKTLFENEVKIGDMKLTQTALEERYESLEFKLHAELDIRHNLEAELMQITKDRNLIRKESADYKSSLHTATNTIEKIRFELQNAEATTNTLHDAKHQLEEKLAMKDQDVAELHGVKCEADDKIALLKRELSTSLLRISDEKSTSSELRQALTQTTTKLVIAQEQLRTTQHEISQLKTALEEEHMELVTTRGQSEEDFRNAIQKEKKLVDRIGVLMQQAELARTHPFSTLSVHLYQIVLGKAKSMMFWSSPDFSRGSTPSSVNDGTGNGTPESLGMDGRRLVARAIGDIAKWAGLGAGEPRSEAVQALIPPGVPSHIS
ncbi:hypothetical protein BKA65DRAFT_547774 [Rhexocercosporidium sp. MPI-PUGE-AT-0058]|nr:hypothetical protein BKA65DRAFT_547774 [Rhexocercosporidium sp. MPI-PUGE-AT-0058]